MSATTAASARTGVPGQSMLAVAGRQLRGLKILLPFLALIALWWAIYASGDFSPQVLVSPLTVWRAFVHLVTYGVMADARPSVMWRFWWMKGFPNGWITKTGTPLWRRSPGR